MNKIKQTKLDLSKNEPNQTTKITFFKRALIRKKILHDYRTYSDPKFLLHQIEPIIPQIILFSSILGYVAVNKKSYLLKSIGTLTGSFFSIFYFEFYLEEHKFHNQLLNLKLESQFLRRKLINAYSEGNYESSQLPQYIKACEEYDRLLGIIK